MFRLGRSGIPTSCGGSRSGPRTCFSWQRTSSVSRGRNPEDLSQASFRGKRPGEASTENGDIPLVRGVFLNLAAFADFPSFEGHFAADGAFPGKVPKHRIDFFLQKPVTRNSSQIGPTFFTAHLSSPTIAFQFLSRGNKHRAPCVQPIGG